MKFVFSLFFILSFITFFTQDAVVNDASLPEAEFHTAINPLDSSNMIIATIYGYGDEINGFDITIYYTNDFGETWSESDYNAVAPTDQFSGDAVLGFNANGKAILCNLSASGTFNSVNTILSESTDGGATWTNVKTVQSGFTDKPWMAIDRYATSNFNGNIYVPLIEFAPSLFVVDSLYESVSSITIPNGDQLPSVVVRKDGKVFTSTVGLGDPNRVYVQEYDNAGQVIVHSTEVVSFPDFTFNVPDISERFQPTVYLAIDNSGGDYDGRLYLSYTASEDLNTTYFNVFLTYSDDNGLTWSEPHIVHDNTENEVQQFYSSIYVNDNGVVIMDWYDRKNHENSNTFTDFMIGVSHDGGDTFEETQLNTESTNFDFVVPTSDSFGIGEYHQVLATDHTAISFWSDGRTNDGDLNIYMAKLGIDNIVGIHEFNVISSEINVSALYPSPSNGQTFTDIVLTKDQNLKYEIFNLEGKLILESNWKRYPTGSHQIELDNIDKSGLYFVKIFNDTGYLKTMKLIRE